MLILYLSRDDLGAGDDDTTDRDDQATATGRGSAAAGKCDRGVHGVLAPVRGCGGVSGVLREGAVADLSGVRRGRLA